MEQSIKQQNNMDLLSMIGEQFSFGEQDPKQYSPLTLAYIGDAIYDLIIRTIIVNRGNAPVNQLHKTVSNMVKAAAQAELLHKIEPFLNEEEVAVYKRGRNAKSYTKAKNASVVDYRYATGLEALVGFLYLNHQTERIIELLKIGLEEIREDKNYDE